MMKLDSKQYQTNRRSVAMAAVVLAGLTFGATVADAAPAYIVTSGADSGVGTLREALASGATDIVIRPSVSTITTDTTLEYSGTAALSIRGAGQTIDGAGNGNTLLEITNGANLTISNLSFTDGGGYGLPPNEGGGKGIFVDVPLDREGVVRLSLTNVAVTGVGAHGIHVLDCDLEGCGAGGGGGGDGSPASIHVRLTRVTVDDAGNGGFDADGVRIDERSEGSIVFSAVHSNFRNIGADGVELDEGDNGSVSINVRNSLFEDNGGYCEGVDVNSPADGACVEDDDGELVLDLDDGFDVDEAGNGDLTGRVTHVWVSDNLDEGLDFDEEGSGGINLTLVDAHTWGNGDEGIKLSEEDAGHVTANLRAVTAIDNGDDGIQIEEEDGGDITVGVNATSTSGNAKNGLKVTEDGDGTGTLRVRGSNISEGIDTENVDQL
jgi:hypothetical protein